MATFFALPEVADEMNYFLTRKKNTVISFEVLVNKVLTIPYIGNCRAQHKGFDFNLIW